MNPYLLIHLIQKKKKKKFVKNQTNPPPRKSSIQKKKKKKSIFSYESLRTLPLHQQHRSTSVCHPIELKIGRNVNDT
jgi:hypothetical protein